MFFLKGNKDNYFLYNFSAILMMIVRLDMTDMKSISDLLEKYARGSPLVKDSNAEQRFLTREIVRLFRKWLKNQGWEGTLPSKSSRLAVYWSIYKNLP